MREEEKPFLKVGGVLFVESLALLANSTGVYALAIFIVATFITKLDFLENLAALFWGRKEFWEYKKQLWIGSASKEEVDKKVKKEIEQEQEQEQIINRTQLLGIDRTTTYGSLKYKYYEFEQSVVEALKKQAVFLSVTQGVKLSVDGVHHIIDAIAFNFDTDFIIEIKMTNSKHIVKNAVSKVRQYINVYNQYNNREIFLRREVKGIIIVPDSFELDDIVSDIAILKFDSTKNQFTNLESLKRLIKNPCKWQ